MSDDLEDFNEFFRVEFVLLIAFLRRSGHELEESRDAAAEAMLCAFQEWAHVKYPRAWVRTAAYRIALRQLTKQRGIAERVVSAGMLSGDLDPDLADEVVGQHRVVALLACLSTREREVVNWYLDGFKTNEIAKALGVSKATVRSTMRHARERLRRCLEDELNRPPGEEERGYGS